MTLAAPSPAPAPAPAPAPGPAVARRRVAHQLRAMRHAARMTLDEAAPRLDMLRSRLHRLETGQTAADVHVVRSMMDLYEQYMPGLLDLVRVARARGWWRDLDLRNHDYVSMEAGATHIDEVAAQRIPDLLQTPDYTRALLRGSGASSPNRRQLGHELEARPKRQARLTTASDPLTYTAVLDEAALRNQIGNPQVMRAQLTHLVERAALPRVRLRILPATAGAQIRVGSFSLLTFDHPNDPPIAYIDQLGDLVREEQPDRVHTVRTHFNDLESATWSDDESISFIEQLTRDLASSIP